MRRAGGLKQTARVTTERRTLEDTLAWAADGAAHLRGLMERMGEDAFPAPSGLPGWSRAHVLSHIARNADGMINLLTWARTGTPTPAYPSAQARDADIEAGARRPPAEIRADVVESSDRLADVVRAMPDKAWSATVRNVQGREIPASDIPWVRAKEMWIHAVDLDVGAAFTDLPGPMLRALVADVAATLGSAADCPAVRLVAEDPHLTLDLGKGGERIEVRGPAAAITGWLLGRERGRALHTADGSRLPALPRWL
jgi:maleylpyruvate isomerase